MIVIKEPIAFEWDEGNHDKNQIKHQVTLVEAEEVFLDQHKKISKDLLHSKTEDRYLIIGHTKNSRKLFMVFTLRKQKVRIISARDLNKREYKLLEG